MAFGDQDFGDDPPTRRGNGLHPDIIDTLPSKTYSANENEDIGNAAGDQNEECCPICLVEYEEGHELRVLPCGHAMHKPCLDAWLLNNPSCPSCRHSLSELVDDRPMLQLRTLRSRLSNTQALARFLGHDNATEEGIEMAGRIGEDASIPRDVGVDLRYVPSLALSGEEGMDQSSQPPAMDDLASRRRRRRELQRERRRSSASRLRQNLSRIRSQRRSRVPLSDIDEDS